MLFDAELINLILYCIQQLGIALGLGSQTIMLVAFAGAMRNGVIDDVEAQFLRATRSTLWVSLTLIAVSGIAITLQHLLAGQGATVFTPAYLFKSLLIVLVIVLTATLHVLPETFAEGLLGGTWYALFLVHILAPVTSWINLLTLYAIWLIGFNLIWYVIAFSTRENHGRKKVPVQAESSEAVILKKSAPIIQVPKEPVQFQAIKLDPVYKTRPVVTPEALKPVQVTLPIAPPPAPNPMQQIKTDPAPIAPRPATPAFPVEKMPASIATDTPFLPQVPPLQPIPTIPPQNTGPLPAAGIPVSTDSSVLQKPEELPVTVPTISPEIKLGLNVMPKSPDQMST